MDLPDKNNGDIYDASEWVQFKNEVENAILSSNQALSSSSVQLKQALARYANNGASYTDNGASNAYNLITKGNNDTLTAYRDGDRFTFVAGNTNTGTSLLSINGLGTRTIKKNGFSENLSSGDIVAGNLYSVYYNLASDFFELSNNVMCLPLTGGTLTGTLTLNGAIVQLNAFTNQLGKNLELGSIGIDQNALIDFHCSSDVSQDDYSSRIIRNSGLDGSFTIDHRGTGAINILGGGSIGLNPASGLIFCNSARLLNVVTPIGSTDGANKQYVDDTVNGQGWVAYCRYNGDTGAIISESGINTWSRTAEGRYAMTFDSGIMSTTAYGAFTMQTQTSSSISYCSMNDGKTTSGGTVNNTGSGGDYVDGSGDQITFFFGGQ